MTTTDETLHVQLFNNRTKELYLFPSSYFGKVKSKNWKNTSMLVCEKVTQLVTRALVAVRRKKKLV